MELLTQGGLVMWPLLGLSVAALAILVERFLIVIACPFPGKAFDGLLRRAVRTGNVRLLTEDMARVPLLQAFTAIIADPAHPRREAALQLEGEAVIRSLEQRLPLLGLMARVAPLLGLLGTIIGMITTFARIASAKSGVDMGMLADGIWQALITTATGLVIAIPILLCLGLLQGRVRRVRAALTDAGNVALLLARPEPLLAGSDAEAVGHA